MKLANQTSQENTPPRAATPRHFHLGGTEENYGTYRSLEEAEAAVAEQATRWIARYGAASARGDSMKAGMTLAAYLRFMNEPAQLRASHGQYLVGQIEVGGDGDYIGADMRTAWFNRNLRIYSNVQRAVSTPGDRLLLIIGAGHVPILRHLVESSPELALVEAGEYLPR